METLFTERLILRPVREEDLDDICVYGTDGEVGLYMTYWPKTREEIAAFIRESVESMNAPEPGRMEYAMELKNSGRVIGNISLIFHKDEAEIGWLSGKAYWNRGYMTEAAGAVLRKALCEPRVHRIAATCTEKNSGSRRVMEKIGMRRIKREEDQKTLYRGGEITFTRLTYEAAKSEDA